MASSRIPGPIGLCDINPNFDDGTLIRGLSPLPGPVDATPSYFYDPGINQLLRKLRIVSNGDDLQQIVFTLLGPRCFSAGVIAGMGVEILTGVEEIFKLARTLVLADLYDLVTRKASWWQYLNPLTANKLLIAEITGLFFEKELRDAATERDAIIQELSVAMQNPGETFEGIKDALIDGYQKDWDDFNAHMGAGTLEGQFHAGMIFGRLLVYVLGLLTGVVGAARTGAKIATKLPRLLQYARSVRHPEILRMPRRGGGGGGGGGSVEAPSPNPNPEAIPSNRRPAPRQKRQLQPEPERTPSVTFGERGAYKEPGAQTVTDTLRRDMAAASARKNQPPPEKAGWPKIDSGNAATFKTPPKPVDLPEGTTIYRVIDADSNPNGSYWTLTDPKTMTEAQWRAGAAVKGSWNGDGAFVEYKVPPGGMKVWSGEASPQMSSNGVHVLPGGGNQVWMPQGTTTASQPISTGWVK